MMHLQQKKKYSYIYLPLYIHKESNHPANIIKNIPKSVNKRLSTISTNESTFNKAAPPYQEALNKSGFKYMLKHEADEDKSSMESTKRKHSRKRNVTWSTNKQNSK